HASTAKRGHECRLKLYPLQLRLVPVNGSNIEDVKPSSSSSTSTPASVQLYSVKEKALNAELIWATKTVSSDYSASSCEDKRNSLVQANSFASIWKLLKKTSIKAEQNEEKKRKFEESKATSTREEMLHSKIQEANSKTTTDVLFHEVSKKLKFALEKKDLREDEGAHAMCEPEMQQVETASQNNTVVAAATPISSRAPSAPGGRVKAKQQKAPPKVIDFLALNLWKLEH
ncbi:unnamed protein product, partial [Timema podura]|nr:unnamed protein product [Timema podura]